MTHGTTLFTDSSASSPFLILLVKTNLGTTRSILITLSTYHSPDLPCYLPYGCCIHSSKALFHCDASFLIYLTRLYLIFVLHSYPFEVQSKEMPIRRLGWTLLSRRPYVMS